MKLSGVLFLKPKVEICLTTLPKVKFNDTKLKV